MLFLTLSHAIPSCARQHHVEVGLRWLTSMIDMGSEPKHHLGQTFKNGGHKAWLAKNPHDCYPHDDYDISLLQKIISFVPTINLNDTLQYSGQGFSKIKPL